MTYGMRTALGIVAAVAGLCFAPELAAGEAKQLAVVDVSKVFKTYKKVADVERRLQSQFETRRKELEEEARILKDLAEKIQRMREHARADSELLFDTLQGFNKKEFLYRKALNQVESEVQKRYGEEMRDVLNEIKAAVRVEAQSRGFEIVVRTPYSDDELSLNEEEAAADPAKEHPLDEQIKGILEPQSTEALVLRFKRNPVLFGTQAADLTDAVLKRLNDEYAQRATGAQKAP